jgi:putative iron-dependent peroxidase
MIGRRLDDNEEIADAPESAHVKRTAQELFDPEAFMVRRSQPWASAEGQGLEFIGYGASLDAFERMMKRMAGIEDGLSDSLFTFSGPVNGLLLVSAAVGQSAGFNLARTVIPRSSGTGSGKSR